MNQQGKFDANHQSADELSSSFESDEDFGWVSYFLTLKGNEFFCQVDEDYITDNFNLTGLANQVPYYEYALDLITDVDNEGKNACLPIQRTQAFFPPPTYSFAVPFFL